MYTGISSFMNSEITQQDLQNIIENIDFYQIKSSDIQYHYLFSKNLQILLSMKLNIQNCLELYDVFYFNLVFRCSEFNNSKDADSRVHL